MRACKCGQNTGDCTCPTQEPIINDSKPLMGWICPVCKAGNSPYSTRCNCQPYHYSPYPYPVNPTFPPPWYGTPIYCSTKNVNGY